MSTIKIKMFTSNTCSQCKTAKQQLSFVPVPVEITEYNIDTDNYVYENGHEIPALEYLTDVLGSMSTPTFEFESGRKIFGFEMGELMEELGL